MKVSLLRLDGLDTAMLGASCCVSEDMPAEPNPKALLGAARSGHLSVLEHAVASFAIEGISRACSHQLVRHRLASYCISGNTKIRTSSQKTNGKTVRELYEMTPQYFAMLKLRCVDESNGNIRYNHPEKIVYSGVKPTYTVKTIHGYTIRTTKEHRFLTENGWKALEDIEIGEKVYINGQNSYKDRDWLYHMYHVKNMSQQDIGNICGVSKDCIRSWVRRFGLQKERGSWNIGVEPPNKGKTKETYEPMRRTSKKMMGNHNPSMYRKGAEKIGVWKGDDVTESGLRTRTARIMYPKRTNVCALCGFHGVTEFHHMNGDLTEYNANMIELCAACHKAIHRKEITQRIVLSEVTSIEYYGYEDTYDVIMPNPHHNFIADGFVVHNSQQSQRYVKMAVSSRDPFEYVIPESIRADRGACEEYERLMSAIAEVYGRLVDCYKVPMEDARYVLPNACATNIVVTMNLRSLSHACGLRRCVRAQREARELFDEMARLVEVRLEEEGLGELCGLFEPQCMQRGYCPEARCCGASPTLAELKGTYRRTGE